MKKICLILVLIGFLNGHINKYKYNYCNKDIYTVYYFYLTAEAFCSIDRKTILETHAFKIPSCKIKQLFKDVLSQDGKGMKPVRYLDYDVRVLIRDNKNNEIIITKELNVISLRKYKVNKKILNDVIDEVSKVGEAIGS